MRKYRHISVKNLQPRQTLVLRGSPQVVQRVALISRTQLKSPASLVAAVLEEELTDIEALRDKLQVVSQILRRKQDLQHFKTH